MYEANRHFSVFVQKRQYKGQYALLLLYSSVCSVVSACCKEGHSYGGVSCRCLGYQFAVGGKINIMSEKIGFQRLVIVSH
jgi:hypothetical protein